MVLTFSIVVYFDLKKRLGKLTQILPALVILQIILGLLVIFFHVPVSIALIHQGGAVVVFSCAIIVFHRNSAYKNYV